MSGDAGRPRLVGVNHVALEVNDVEEAIVWYGQLFDFPIRGRGNGSAYLDMGDQFLALTEHTDGSADEARHVGIVVDDLDAALEIIEERGIERTAGGGVNIRDPWGNRLQLVEYRQIQFTKADHVLRGMGLPDLDKARGALEELEAKEMSPD